MDKQSSTILASIPKTSKSGSYELNPAEQEERKTQEKIRLFERIKDTGISKRHLKATNLILNNEWSKSLDMLESKLKTGMLYALLGSRGTGKTQMAVRLIKNLCTKMAADYGYYGGAKYSVTMDFFMAIKQTYNDSGGSSERKILYDFLSPQLLVLDEIHERGETEWENRLLTHMIDKRYGEMKDTILISNQTLGVFQKSIGSSILSRLQETGAIIECTWPSFREPDGGEI